IWLLLGGNNCGNASRKSRSAERRLESYFEIITNPSIFALKIFVRRVTECCLQLPSPLHRFHHCDLIGVLDVTAGGDAGSNAGHFESGAAELAGKIGGRGLAFDSGIGGE